MAPVTVFLVAIACLLVAAAAVRPLALRTGVPEAVWLIGLGVVLRASGLVSLPTIAALAPFFAALALIMVLFEAGRDMVFGAASEQVGRARKLALAGAALVVPVVALFSQALSGLQLLPVWSWTHALMLGALMLCSAPEVFAPTLYRRAHPGLVATLEREAALTGALAIAATAVCIDLLSLRVPLGKAYAAIAAGFGLGLAFGAFAGLLWITAIRRVGPGRGVYPYTLAAILALYVVTDTLGGLGALAVLVFGAVVSNAGPLVGALFRPRGTVVEAADEDFRAALDDHARTVEITRVLLFTFIGLGLGPPWGLVAMGIVLGLLLVVLRLLAARLVLRGVDERTFSALALGWPRGMLIAGLAALPHAAAVPGTESLTTLVFSAVATTCVAFAVAVSPLGHASLGGSEDMSKREGEPGQGPKDMSPGTVTVPRAVAPAATVAEVLAAGPARPEVGATGRPAGVAIVGPTAETPERPLLVAELESERAQVVSAIAVPPAAGALAGEPGAGGRTLLPEGAALGGPASASGRTVVAGEPIAGTGTLVPGEPSGGIAELSEPIVRTGTLVPGEPLTGARVGTGTLVPGEPVPSGWVAELSEPIMRTGTLVPGEPLTGARVGTGTLVPGEANASTRTVGTGTLVPGEANASTWTVGTGTLVPGEANAGTRTVGTGTLVPGEANASTRTAAGESMSRGTLTGEPATGVPRFAPPGTTRGAERTVMRASGPGAPELVRHVFISGPAPTRTIEATTSPLPGTMSGGGPDTRAAERAPAMAREPVSATSPGHATEAAKFVDPAPRAADRTGATVIAGEPVRASERASAGGPATLAVELAGTTARTSEPADSAEGAGLTVIVHEPVKVVGPVKAEQAGTTVIAPVTESAVREPERITGIAVAPVMAADSSAPVPGGIGGIAVAPVMAADSSAPVRGGIGGSVVAPVTAADSGAPGGIAGIAVAPVRVGESVPDRAGASERASVPEAGEPAKVGGEAGKEPPLLELLNEALQGPPDSSAPAQGTHATDRDEKKGG